MSILDKFRLELQPFLDQTGYVPKTTFWTDFSIAEPFGFNAIHDTYERAFNEWKKDTVFITELAMVLNWKAWQYCKTDIELSKYYQRLWHETDTWIFENLKDDDLQYYIRQTD